jgi:hypothetical protein
MNGHFSQYLVMVLRGWATGFLFSARESLFRHRVQIGSGARPVSYPMGNRTNFSEGKTAEAWNWQIISIQCWG